MKEFDQLNHQEKCDLTDDEVKRLIDYECAKNGIKLLDPPVTPQKQTFKYDACVYEVCGFHTESEAAAQKLATFFADIRGDLVELETNWRVSSDHKFVRRLLNEYERRTEIKKVPCFSPEKYREQEGELTAYKEKTSRYEADLKAYTENEEKRNKETKWLRTDIYAHQRLEQITKKYIEQNNRFVELADGNAEISEKFFRKMLEGEESKEISSYVMQRVYPAKLAPNEYMDTQPLLEEAVACVAEGL